jgi:hypothetical protein
MLNPLRRLQRRVVHPRDLDGWTPVRAVDPRTPARPANRRGAGPWVEGGRPAHGLYERPHSTGMADWAAAYHGRMLWRWRGPRMDWTSPLVSPWNPLLAQQLVLDQFDWCGLSWGVDSEEWTGAAVLAGHKTGGYFGLRPRPRMHEWVARARQAGIAVEFYRDRCWAFAAQAGTVGATFDLLALATEYMRVLPAPLGRKVGRELLDHADVPLLTAAVHHEDYPEAVCGLALGYPPEVTAGLLTPRRHRRAHLPDCAEFGAYCPFCD